VLERVRVKDFQSLRDVDITLGRFTVIVGESGCGKSAFIRSVLKLVRNDAVSGTSSGEEWSHLPPGASNAEVILNVDDHEVRWIKGKSNSYIIDGESLHKVGKGCPDEVQDVLTMRELTFDGTDHYHLNFAQQFDMPFLLDDSGSRVAKILGEITNVNVLYAANRQANSQKTAAAKKLSLREQDLAEQQLLLTQWAELPAERARLAKMLELREQLTAEVEQFKALCATASKLDRLQNAVASCSARKAVLSTMEQASDVIVSLFNDIATFVKLREYGMEMGTAMADGTGLLERAKLLNPVRKIDTDALWDELLKFGEMHRQSLRLASLQSIVDTLEQETARLEPVGTFVVSGLTNSVATYQGILTNLQLLKSRESAVSQGYTDIDSAERRWREAVIEYESFVAENPTCPLCGNLLPCDEDEVLV
jgi:hypothetical protein